jgi:hypothetical protein
MSVVLRALVMLAAVVPLFAATAFRPPWWQTLLAAIIGAALGQLAVRATRGRRVAAWSVAVAAAIVAAAASGWSLVHASDRDHTAGPGFLMVRSRDSIPSLTWDDIRAIETQIPSIHLAVPYLHHAEQLTSEDMNWKTEVVGTTPDYFDLRGITVAAGRRFGSTESEKVVVLGETVVTQLFGAHKSAVGELIRIDNRPFTIIGVLAHQGMSPQGQDLDDVAIVPVEVYLRITAAVKSRFGGTILISPTTPGDTIRVEAELRALLRDRHRLADGTDDDFVIRDPNAK